ncbi:YcxB family protein [Parvularcula sp. LCG005]|uniref:YcxB family protein n=1 Tax=Parvularcula sp. LCG005 TaxID=3078805 RepID=UPI002943D3DC|nr:YcxB family protein [Parvularcula sp. LCG005]WOI53849.1 YcxB family protein [Parvularcula sp. LCG005]
MRQTYSAQRTKNDFAAYVRSSQRRLWNGTWRSWRTWLAALIPWVFAAGMGFLWSLLDKYSIPTTHSYILGALLGATGYRFAANNISRRFMLPPTKGLGPFCGNVVLTINDAGLKTECNGVSYSAPWSAIDGASQEHQTIIVHTDRCEGFVIPFAAFPSDEERVVFIQLVNDKIAHPGVI